MKLNSRFVSTPALYVLLAALLLTSFFELWRLILMLAADTPLRDIPAPVLLKSYVIGARFDFRVASGIMLLLLLPAIIPGLDIARNRIVRTVHFILLCSIAAATFFLHLADIEFFRYFNTRLNGSALLWTDAPGDMISMIWQTYPVIRWLLLWILMTGLFVLALRFLLRRVVLARKPSPTLTNLFWTPLVLAIFVMGAIGRLYEIAPMRWGLAYFSPYDFANQLALNPAEQFLRDVLYDSNKRQQLKDLVAGMRDPDARAIACDLLGAQLPENPRQRIVRPVRFAPPDATPPNVIVIIMESFAASKIGSLRSEYPYDLSPQFDSIAQHGILFTNFYSSGTHTYSGLFTTLYGVPHLFGKVIMKQVGGYGYFQGLPVILRDYGYRTTFFTTQDPHFDNMQGFLRAHGMMDVYGIFDFDRSMEFSWLGVPDHVMFDSAFSKLRVRGETGEPFFATLLTGSNHGPWKYPDVPFERIPASEKNAEELNAFKYADWALGRFLRQVNDDPAFDNTIVVVTADNGYKWNPTTDLDLSILEIPLFLFDTDLDRYPGERNPRLGHQCDILPTVMGLLRLDYDNYSFGKDLLDTTAPGQDHVLATRWYEIGYLQDSCYTITRQNGGADSFFRLAKKAVDVKDSLPDLFQLHKRRALAIFQTAYDEMYKPIDTERVEVPLAGEAK